MPMNAETKEKFEAEERASWAQRDELLTKYPGKWVAIVGGMVVAVGDRLNKVSAEAYRKTGSKVKYVALVGDENVEFVIRKTISGYYSSGPHFEIPKVIAEVQDVEGSEHTTEEFVIDTGADISLFSADTCDKLGLQDHPAATAWIRGITGPAERRLLLDAVTVIGDYPVEVAVDCREDLSDPILGRDAINEFSLTLCFKRDEVSFQWVD